MVKLCTDKHPLEVDVTVAVTIPLHNPVAVLVLAPLVTTPVLQLNVNGAVPDVTDKDAIALHVPLHNAFTEEKLNTGALTFVSGNTKVLEQPDASVTTTVYVPTPSPVKLDVVAPPGDHKYVYPGLPPVTVKEIEPVGEEHGGCVTKGVTVKLFAEEIFTDEFRIQPTASVI